MTWSATHSMKFDFRGSLQGAFRGEPSSCIDTIATLENVHESSGAADHGMTSICSPHEYFCSNCPDNNTFFSTINALRFCESPRELHRVHVHSDDRVFSIHCMPADHGLLTGVLPQSVNITECSSRRLTLLVLSTMQGLHSGLDRCECWYTKQVPAGDTQHVCWCTQPRGWTQPRGAQKIGLKAKKQQVRS